MKDYFFSIVVPGFVDLLFILNDLAKLFKALDSNRSNVGMAVYIIFSFFQIYKGTRFAGEKLQSPLLSEKYCKLKSCFYSQQARSDSNSCVDHMTVLTALRPTP